MKFKSLTVCLLLSAVYIGLAQPANPIQRKKEDRRPISGHFEGTEPFWDMEVRDNVIILNIVNDTVLDTLFLSRKQTHTETYAFRGGHVFGIIRQSSGEGCQLDITETPNPTHEIYFSYKDVTYMGCGKLN